MNVNKVYLEGKTLADIHNCLHSRQKLSFPIPGNSHSSPPTLQLPEVLKNTDLIWSLLCLSVGLFYYEKRQFSLYHQSYNCLLTLSVHLVFTGFSSYWFSFFLWISLKRYRCTRKLSIWLCLSLHVFKRTLNMCSSWTICSAAYGTTILL